MDVVGWRPFAGGGGAFACVLMQNTLAMDFKRKPGDIVPTRWLKMIDFGDVPPIGLAVPFAVEPSSKQFIRVADQARIFMDRLRLFENLVGVDLTPFPEWQLIADWNTSQKPLIVTALAKAAAATKGRTRKAAKRRTAKKKE